MIGVDHLLYDEYEPWKEYLRDLASVGVLHTFTGFLTVPATLVHGWRLRFGRPLATASSHLAIAAATTAWLTRDQGELLLVPGGAFCALLALGHVAGIELALRSRR